LSGRKESAFVERREAVIVGSGLAGAATAVTPVGTDSDVVSAVHTVVEVVDGVVGGSSSLC